MNEFHIISIDNPDNPYMEHVKELFTDMYLYMQHHGLMLELAENGAELWLASLRNTLGKFGILCVAVEYEKVIGFAHGALKFGPDYLGSPKIGLITHIYVREETQKKGTGEALVNALYDWFREKKVGSVELQVISGNSKGIAFWEKLGFTRELFQYRKFMD